jgi:IS605 OrfB family transposase
MPQLYTIRTDFGRLARRYEKVRNAIIEKLKPEFALPNGKYVNITNTREFRKRAKKLRERVRKVGRVRQIANELTKTPAIIVTEELGEKPQESMIEDIMKDELRHRIKQTPFKSIEKTVEDKALERGSRVFRVSSYRNSRICPVHFTKLERTYDWHSLYCPKGHYVHRDYASVLNMMWKVTPEGWVKGVWWNLKRLSKNINWRKHEGKSNPLIPHPIVKYLHTTLKECKGQPREKPRNAGPGQTHEPHRMQDEGGGEETSHTLQGREEASRLLNR